MSLCLCFSPADEEGCWFFSSVIPPITITDFPSAAIYVLFTELFKFLKSILNVLSFHVSDLVDPD